MSSASKRKGSAGERELAKILCSYGLPEATRMPLSGALPDFAGDVKLHGFNCEVKRTERLDLWGAIRQSEAAARGGVIPIVAFRRNHSVWYVVERLETWAPRVAEIRMVEISA